MYKYTEGVYIVVVVVALLLRLRLGAVEQITNNRRARLVAGNALQHESAYTIYIDI